ncbi:hypothetical protein GH714_012516 [Hevea brasiliensis]|uniref:EF-hand domain-containing protein n=1 Tax=Hevea brasiliensis TaxID=3981 RepID=A0A6A6K6B5_HEVBR|nr:hypothetical protein GH714_012516 [Hevea brasiliensis]
MATDNRIPKPSKWFSNKSLRLSLHRRRSKSSSTLSSPSSPMSPCTPQNNSKENELKEAQAVIDDLDSDGDKLLDFKDFLSLMKREANEEDDDLKKAFEMFEMEKGSGCITPKGLQRMLHRLGDAKSYDECVAMIHVFDTDGNGVLDFQEFHQMMA